MLRCSQYLHGYCCTSYKLSMLVAMIYAWILQAVYAWLCKHTLQGVYTWILQAFYARDIASSLCLSITSKYRRLGLNIASILCLGYCKQSLLEYWKQFVHNYCKQSLHRNWRRFIRGYCKLWVGQKIYISSSQIHPEKLECTLFSPCENIMYTNWSNANNFTNPIYVYSIYLSGSNPLKLCPPPPDPNPMQHLE